MTRPPGCAMSRRVGHLQRLRFRNSRDRKTGDRPPGCHTWSLRPRSNPSSVRLRRSSATGCSNSRKSERIPRSRRRTGRERRSRPSRASSSVRLLSSRSGTIARTAANASTGWGGGPAGGPFRISPSRSTMGRPFLIWIEPDPYGAPLRPCGAPLQESAHCGGAASAGG